MIHKDSAFTCSGEGGAVGGVQLQQQVLALASSDAVRIEQLQTSVSQMLTLLQRQQQETELLREEVQRSRTVQVKFVQPLTITLV